MVFVHPMFLERARKEDVKIFSKEVIFLSFGGIFKAFSKFISNFLFPNGFSHK